VDSSAWIDDFNAVASPATDTLDIALATYCIDERRPLLHDDRDFDAFEQHLGLQRV